MKTMTDELKLKPCPFCGGDAKIKCGEIVNRYNTAVYRHYHVECMSCGVDTRYFDTEADAIEAWNRRVATDMNVGDKERTAKVICRGTTMGLSFCCGNCGKPVHSEGEYCHHCGARLDWSE